MTKKYLIVFLIAALLFIPTAFADVIQPGEKAINFDYQLTNIKDYPDYVFILHGMPSPTMEILSSSEFSFYKFSTCSIYAIKKTDFNKINMSKMNDTEVETFLMNDSLVARSNLELEGQYGSVTIDNPLEGALVLLRINSIQGNNLEIQKTKIVYGYSDGKKTEKTFQSQNQTPEPPNSQNSLTNYIYYLVVPIIAAIILIYIIAKRKSNKQ
ncbi:MAG: hypothetical protein Q7U35_02095 [Methanobacteriaceae archaeon]|nr:hypothetical protein [Methanobacteriaceae archaeon]MDP2835681.1 hypothetical protein [Methanobacteriaceae archaeon]MDP3035168.1 hypothetical protein [Methanobacteriaceae archaeon]MDP3485890.1 hypothetical protein [Methanobacteriaceae archaeon]MDP3622898.1 hypothetical protein [Methanobacteriaceae archaeon]